MRKEVQPTVKERGNESEITASTQRPRGGNCPENNRVRVHATGRRRKVVSRNPN